MIEIVRAPAHLVIQDNGFVGSRSIGLPRAGAMDRNALRLGNSIVGNTPSDAGLEWALSGGTLRFACDAIVALTGAAVHGRLGESVIAMNSRIQVRAGDVLEIDRFIHGRFLYLCVSPAPDVKLVFGSKSTYLPGSIGGLSGRRIKSGDLVKLAAGVSHNKSALLPATDYGETRLRVLPGPQSGALDGRLLSYLLGSEFAVSHASDRTGYRLDGPQIDTTGLPQILSEPACEGAVQVTDSGMPIILMADGPTIGGYNKIAVVLNEDLPLLAQKTPGEKVRFALGRG